MTAGRVGESLRVAGRRLRRAVGLTEATARWLWRAALGLAVGAGLGLGLLAWRLPGERPAFAARLERVVGYRLDVARAHLGRAGLRPAVVLEGVRFAGAGAAATPSRAARVRLGLAWNALLRGRLEPVTLVVEGLETTVECTPQGRCRWLPRGMPARGGPGAAPAVAPAVDPRAATGWLARLAAFDAVTLTPAGVRVLAPDGHRLGRVTLERVAFARVGGGFRVLARADLPDAVGRYVEFETQVRGDPARRASWRGDWVLRGRNLGLGWAAPWQAPGVHLEARDLVAALHGRWQDGAVAALAFDVTARRLAALRDTGPLVEWRELAAHGRLAPPGAGHPEVWWGRLDSLATSAWTGTTGRLTVEACAAFPACPTALALDGLPDLAVLTPWLAALRYANPAARFLENGSGGLEGVVVAKGAGGLAASGRVNGFTRPPGALGLGLGPVSGRFAANADRGWFVPDPEQAVRLGWPAVLGARQPRLMPRSAVVWRRLEGGWWLTGPTLGVAVPGLADGAVVVDPEITWPGQGRPPEARVQARIDGLPWRALTPWLGPGQVLALPGGWPAGLDGGRVRAGRLLWLGPLVADVRPGQARRDARWLWRGQLAEVSTAAPGPGATTGSAAGSTAGGPVPATPVLADGAGTLALSPTALSLTLQAGRLGGLPLAAMTLAGRPGHELSWQARAGGAAGPAASVWLPVAPLYEPPGRPGAGRLDPGGWLEVAASGLVAPGFRLAARATAFVARDVRLVRPAQAPLRLSGRTRRDADGGWREASFSVRQGGSRYTGRLRGRNLVLDGAGPAPSWLQAPPPPPPPPTPADAGDEPAGVPAPEPPAGGGGAGEASGLRWHAEVLDPGLPGQRVSRFDWRLEPVPVPADTVEMPAPAFTPAPTPAIPTPAVP